MADLSLPTLLNAEAGVIAQFIDLLQKEQAALQDGNTDALPAIADSKAPLTVHLNELAIQRNQALSIAGLPPDRTGIEVWLQRYPSPELSQIWSKLHSAIAEARELNELNGKLITLRMQYTNQALSALTVAQRQSGMLYGPDGQPSQFTGRRIIDSV
jgi:flagella synthesis protein FlgN